LKTGGGPGARGPGVEVGPMGQPRLMLTTIRSVCRNLHHQQTGCCLTCVLYNDSFPNHPLSWRGASSWCWSRLVAGRHSVGIPGPINNNCQAKNCSRCSTRQPDSESHAERPARALRDRSRWRGRSSDGRTSRRSAGSCWASLAPRWWKAKCCPVRDAGCAVAAPSAVLLGSFFHHGSRRPSTFHNR
jgi:hypothetical protein